jgi:hypothetical protein
MKKREIMTVMNVFMTLLRQWMAEELLFQPLCDQRFMGMVSMEMGLSK